MSLDGTPMLLIKEDDYIQSNMKGRDKAYKMGSPFENLRSFTKQILQFLSQTKKCNVNQLLLLKETPATAISHTKPLANTSRNKASVVVSTGWCQQNAALHQFYLEHRYQQNHDCFDGYPDGSAQSNPGPQDLIIKKHWNT